MKFVKLPLRASPILPDTGLLRTTGDGISLATPLVCAVDPPTVRRLLTDREKLVLRMICEGLSNADIATLLGVSQQAVRSEVKRLFRKIESKGDEVETLPDASAIPASLAASPEAGSSVFGFVVAGVHHEPH